MNSDTIQDKCESEKSNWLFRFKWGVSAPYLLYLILYQSWALTTYSIEYLIFKGQ